MNEKTPTSTAGVTRLDGYVFAREGYCGPATTKRRVVVAIAGLRSVRK